MQVAERFFYPHAERRGEINPALAKPETARLAGNRLQIIRNVRGSDTVYVDFLKHGEATVYMCHALNLDHWSIRPA